MLTHCFGETPKPCHAMHPLWTHCQHSRESESLPASEKLAGSKGPFRLRGSAWFPESRNLLIPGASEIKGRHSPSLPFFSLSLNLLSIQRPSKEALCWDWLFPDHRPAPALPGPKNVRAPWKESHCTKWVPEFYAHANKGSSRPKSIHTVLHQKHLHGGSGSGNSSPLVKEFHALPNNMDLEFLKSSSAQSHPALLIGLGEPFPHSLSVT